MSREVFEELKQDEAFVEKVANRIYTESDDFEDSMPEPEWICEMTDIANKYIQRFKLAFKLANKVSNQPTLNENQQIVLEYLKTYFGKHEIFVKSIFDPIQELLFDCWDDEVDTAFEQLDLKQEIQVLEVFGQWACEQEEGNEI